MSARSPLCCRARNSSEAVHCSVSSESKLENGAANPTQICRPETSSSSLWLAVRAAARIRWQVLPRTPATRPVWAPARCTSMSALRCRSCEAVTLICLRLVRLTHSMSSRLVSTRPSSRGCTALRSAVRRPTANGCRSATPASRRRAGLLRHLLRRLRRRNLRSMLLPVLGLLSTERAEEQMGSEEERAIFRPVASRTDISRFSRPVHTLTFP